MGRISGWLWIVGALVGIGGAFLPGSQHVGIGWIVGLSIAILLYGIGSVTNLIPWNRASMGALAFGMALTIPVAGLALYLTGGSLSYIEPLLLCSLLYAGFFFPPRWAWPLVAELVLVAGTPLLYDPERDRKRLPAALPRPRRRLPRGDRGDDRAQTPPGRGGGAPARLRQPRPAHRRRQPPQLRPHPEAGADPAHQPAPQPPRRRPDAPGRAADRPRRLQGRQRPPRPPGRRRGPGRGRQPRPRDAALDRHPGPDRRRRVRRDRPRRPRRGRAADGRVDPRRGRHPRPRGQGPQPDRLDRLGRLPRGRRRLREPDPRRRRADAGPEAQRQPLRPRRGARAGGPAGGPRGAPPRSRGAIAAAQPEPARS